MCPQIFFCLKEAFILTFAEIKKIPYIFGNATLKL